MRRPRSRSDGDEVVNQRGAAWTNYPTNLGESLRSVCPVLQTGRRNNKANGTGAQRETIGARADEVSASTGVRFVQHDHVDVYANDAKPGGEYQKLLRQQPRPTANVREPARIGFLRNRLCDAVMQFRSKSRMLQPPDVEALRP